MATPNTRRLLAIACTAVLAAGVAACGDNDDNNGGSGSADAGSQGSERTAANQTSGSDAGTGGAAGEPKTDQGQIKALTVRVQNGLKTGDGETVCAGFTEAGQRDFVAYGQVIGFPGGCPKVAAAITRDNKRNGIGDEPPAKVITVRVRGDKATALLRVPGGGPVKQNFVKVDGQWLYKPWKLARAVGAPTTP